MKKLVVLVLFALPCFGQSYYFQTPFVALAQNKIHFDLFNASGSGKNIHVLIVTVQKNFAAVTGVAWQADFVRTTSAGTGGADVTIKKFDTQAANLPAQITVRSAATGGASLGDVVRQVFFHSEETNQAAQVQEALSVWPPSLPFFRWSYASLVLHEGEGLALKQIGTTTAGTYSVWVAFSVY